MRICACAYIRPCGVRVSGGRVLVSASVSACAVHRYISGVMIGVYVDACGDVEVFVFVYGRVWFVCL